MSKVLVLNPNTGMITMGEGEALLDRLADNLILLMMMRCIVLITLVTLVTLVVHLSFLTIVIFRERADSHYLTVEARDERGRGNRNTVELVIRSVTVTITLIKIIITITIVIATIIKCTNRVKDVNDNAPRFWRDQYESFLPENSNAFETPLVIQAEDRDENGWS